MKCASLTDFPLLIILIYLSNLLYQKLLQTKHACILLVCFSSRIEYDLKKITLQQKCTFINMHVFIANKK